MDLLPGSGNWGLGGGGRGVCGQTVCCCCIRDPLKFDAKHDNVQLNSDLLAPTVKGAGICGCNICYHVTSFSDFLKFDMQHDHALKKLNF